MRIGFQTAVAVILASMPALFGCGDKSKRTYEPTHPPRIIGEWEGTLVVIHRSGADSALTGPIETHFEFTDSNFSYYHFNEWGPIDEYQGTETYVLTDSTIFLNATTGPDPLLVPYRPRPYDYVLDYEHLVISRVDPQPGDVEQEQRIELERVH